MYNCTVAKLDQAQCRMILLIISRDLIILVSPIIIIITVSITPVDLNHVQLRALNYFFFTWNRREPMKCWVGPRDYGKTLHPIIQLLCRCCIIYQPLVTKATSCIFLRCLSVDIGNKPLS